MYRISHEKLCSLLLVSTSIYLLSITQSPAQQNTNPLDDLFDDQWRGLFLGGTVSYGITQSGLSISADRFNEDDKLTIQIAGVCQEAFSADWIRGFRIYGILYHIAVPIGATSLRRVIF